MESEMEVSRVREQERKTEMITKYTPVFIVSLGYYINNTVLCHLGFMGSTFKGTKPWHKELVNIDFLQKHKLASPELLRTERSI